MAKVLQVCGVTIPSAADAWVYKEFTSVPLTDPTGIYIRTEFRWPAASQADWDNPGEEYFPTFLGTGNPDMVWNEAGPQWESGGDRWEYDGNFLDPGGDVTPDTWHTLDLHYHDLTVDAKVDGNTLVANIEAPPEAAGQFYGGGGLSPWGTAAVQKVASPFSLGNFGGPAPPSSILNAVVLNQLSKTGSPSDNIVVQVCDDAGGSPGTVLDAASQPFSAGTKFTFSGGATLSTGTNYWLVVSRSGAPDNTNHYFIATDDSSGTPLFWNGSSWQPGTGVAFLLWTQWLGLSWGAQVTDPVQNKLYVRKIQIGTSGFGSTDLFSEDWSGGSPLSDFDSHSGDLVVVTEPGSAPFTLNATPSSVNVPGGTSTVTSSLVTGSPEPITLSSTGPAGLTVSFATNPISDDGGASLVTFTPSGISPGIYTVTVTGTDGAAETASTPISVSVLPPVPSTHIAS